MLQKLIVSLGLIVLIPIHTFSQVTDTARSDSGAVIIPVIDLGGLDASDGDDVSTVSSQSAAGVFFNSQDPFLFTAGFTLWPYHFRPRAFNNSELRVNGILVEDLERGYSGYGRLGGLNEVLRGRSSTYGLSPSDYGYGASNGTNYIDATAAQQRAGTSISYLSTNSSSYRNRLMITHSSGLKPDGWAYSFSVSHRWAKEGYIPGTFYDGYSVYAGVSKVIGKSQFDLTAFGAPTTSSRNNYAIEEVFQLSGNNLYNPEWGYQNGKKRNDRVATSFQPVIIGNYTYKPSTSTTINLGLGYEFGQYKMSDIDFYNAYNPAPDYYRNLPSYYANFSTPIPEASDAVRAQILSNPNLLQVNWDGLYNANYVNYETIANVNGTGESVTGRRSLYVLGDRVDDLKKVSFNSNVRHSVNAHLNLYGGLRFASQDDRYYKVLEDLMGGDFFLNYNQFASQTTIKIPSYNQNDLNNPNQIVKVGDKYSYDYRINIKESEAWGQTAFTYRQVDFFAAAALGYTSFYREGFMKNGLFPDNSYGTSPAQNFLTHKTKAGAMWKLTSKHHVYVNADYSTDAPKVANTYVNPRKRDLVVNGATTQKTKTIEAGYLFKTHGGFVRLTGYAQDITDMVINKYFFNDDPAYVSFINYIMQGVNVRSTGLEFSGRLDLLENLSLTAMAATGQTYYNNRPYVSFYQDNQPTNIAQERKVYIKNYYLGVGPQTVSSVGLNYHTSSYWNARVNVNYTDRNYVDINPDRRTQEAADLVTPGSDTWNKIYAQEKLPSAFTMDVSGSKSFLVNKYIKSMKHHTTLLLSFGINNVLNNKNIKVAGFEQLRYDYTNRNPDKFPNKYKYALGTTYRVSLTLRF